MRAFRKRQRRPGQKLLSRKAANPSYPSYLVRTPRLRWVSFLGLALIWVGGISNLIDRFVHHGLVTDFIVVWVGPLHTGIFNLADFAIMIGMLLMLVESLRMGSLLDKRNVL